MPAICARHSFPSERFPDFLAKYKAAGSISAALKAYGVESTRKSMTITAKLADRADQKLLKQSWPAPIISVESLYVDQRGHPVDHGSPAMQETASIFRLKKHSPCVDTDISM
jgi:GntR family transcriptional regulator, phosphonate transport system regulatory protein